MVMVKETLLGVILSVDMATILMEEDMETVLSLAGATMEMLHLIQRQVNGRAI